LKAALVGKLLLMDQIAALQWVRDNIEAFGGDAERVMIWPIGRATIRRHYGARRPGVVPRAGMEVVDSERPNFDQASMAAAFAPLVLG
jgi:hypothetical protein